MSDETEHVEDDRQMIELQPWNDQVSVDYLPALPENHLETYRLRAIDITGRETSLTYYRPKTWKTSALAKYIEPHQWNLDTIPLMHTFPTIEGEGSDIGRPRIFVRLGGCLVGCEWCDSRYTWGLKRSKITTIDEIITQLEEVDQDSTKNRPLREASITGGDPMHYPIALWRLAMTLRARGWYLNLETSGTMFSREVFDQFDTVGLDVKTPSSGVLIDPLTIFHIHEVFANHPGVQLKCVIMNQADLDWLAENFYMQLTERSLIRRPLILTPCADTSRGKTIDMSSVQDTANMISEWNDSYNIRVILQQHKVLSFDPSYDK